MLDDKRNALSEEVHVNMAQDDVSAPLQSKLEELVEQGGSHSRPAMRQRTVLVLGRISETVVIKTESNTAVEEADFPLSEMTLPKWFKLLKSAHEKCCNVNGVAFQKLEIFMDLVTSTSSRELSASSLLTHATT